MFLSIIGVILTALGTAQAACDDWVFLCERDVMQIADDTKPIRMPLTSQNCDLAGETASCQSVLTAQPGQKITIKTGVYFGIGANPRDCADGYVMFYSANKEQQKEDKYCGQMGPEITVFDSVSDRVTVTYVSDSAEDGASLYAIAYGCLLEDLSNMDANLELPPNFLYGKGYSVTAACRDGYLFEDMASTKEISCLINTVPGESHYSYNWDTSTAGISCKRMECPDLYQPENGYFELSNGRYHQSTAQLRCYPGYVLDRTSTMLCRVEENFSPRWEGSPPTCQVVDCGPLAIANATIEESNSTEYATVVPYRCNNGLIPTVSEAVCTASGKWFYQKCSACLDLNNVNQTVWRLVDIRTNRQLTSTNSPPEHESITTYHFECVHNGNIFTAPCLYDNILIPTLPECQEVTCNLGETSQYWTAISYSGAPPSRLYEGDTVSYKCEYDGSIATITCLSTGKWDISLSICNKRTSHTPIERMVIDTEPSVARVDTGAIVGGAFAGIVCVVATIALVCLVARRMKRSTKKTLSGGNTEEMVSLRSSTEMSSNRGIQPRRVYYPHMTNGGNIENKTPELTSEYNVMTLRSLSQRNGNTHGDKLNNDLPPTADPPSYDLSSDPPHIEFNLRGDLEAGKAPLEMMENDMYESVNKESDFPDTVLTNPNAS